VASERRLRWRARVSRMRLGGQLALFETVPILDVFVRPELPVWTATTVRFGDVEIGVGYRFGAGTTLKASYRFDDWDVEDWFRRP